MADKLTIEIYRNRNTDELSSAVSDAAGRLEAGSALASCAAQAAALAKRAASLVCERLPENERAAYVLRNAEIIRTYMVELIDKDVQCRGPMRRALKEGGAYEIEACRHASASIDSELVCMMCNLLDLLDSLKGVFEGKERYYCAQSAALAMGIAQSARYAVLSVTDESTDETYRFVSRRENELMLGNYEEIVNNLTSI